MARFCSVFAVFCAFLRCFLGVLGRFWWVSSVVLCLGNGFAMRFLPKFGRLFLGVFGWIFDVVWAWTFVGRFGAKVVWVMVDYCGLAERRNSAFFDNMPPVWNYFLTIVRYFIECNISAKDCIYSRFLHYYIGRVQWETENKIFIFVFWWI